MALNKDHWWIAVVTMCPFYALANLWGSLSLGQRQADGKIKYGSIYGVESWIEKPVFTVIAFIVMAFIQGATFYGSCFLVEKCKPVVDWIDGDDNEGGQKV